MRMLQYTQTSVPIFFTALPRHFEEVSNHIVFNDFNMIFSSQLDQAKTHDRNRLQMQEELLLWKQDLHLIDSWQLQNLGLQEFTSPNNSSRIDYVLLSSTINSIFQDVFHDFSI